MEFDKTIKDIEEFTGLPYHYIIKAIKHLEPLLANYIQRGEKNSILFSSNAMVIFDQIKQMRDNNKSLTSIKKALETSLTATKTTKTENETEVNTTKTESMDYMLSKLEKYHSEVLKLKDEIIEGHKRENQTLKKQILLISDGRDPEEYKREQEQKQQELIILKSEIEIKNERLNSHKEKLIFLEKQKENIEKQKDAEILKQKEKLNKTQDLVSKYESDLSQKEQDLKLKEEVLKQLEEKEKLKKTLLKQLEELEGKWFVGAKRKELLNKLKEL